jgi:opacity protein-like surface antigen
MKYITTLLMAVAFASSAVAGPMSAPKNPKAPVLPPPAPSCGCFGTGAAFDIFGAAILPEGGEDALGGGIGVNYFFTPNIGLDFNYSAFATDSVHHQLDGNIVLRAPIDSLCIAPYALAGGGFATNSSNRGTYQVGAGIDVRLQSMNCLGIFAEGLYHFAADDTPDFTTVRLGVRIPF